MIKIETTSRWGGHRHGAGGRRKPVRRWPDMWQWFCVRTGYGMELLADNEIREIGFEVFNPSVWRAATKARLETNGSVRPARPARIEPMFHRYFFVRLNLADPDWRRVPRKEGVDYIISGAAEDPKAPAIPIAAQEQHIARIRSLCELNDCQYPEEVDLRDLHADTPLTLGGSRFLRRQRRQESDHLAAVAALRRSAHGPIVRTKPLSIGSSARLLDGPLVDLTGICQMSAGKRLELLSGIMGGARITVSRGSVEAF